MKLGVGYTLARLRSTDILRRSVSSTGLVNRAVTRCSLITFFRLRRGRKPITGRKTYSGTRFHANTSPFQSGGVLKLVPPPIDNDAWRRLHPPARRTREQCLSVY